MRVLLCVRNPHDGGGFPKANKDLAQFVANVKQGLMPKHQFLYNVLIDPQHQLPLADFIWLTVRY